MHPQQRSGNHGLFDLSFSFFFLQKVRQRTSPTKARVVLKLGAQLCAIPSTSQVAICACVGAAKLCTARARECANQIRPGNKSFPRGQLPDAWRHVCNGASKPPRRFSRQLRSTAPTVPSSSLGVLNLLSQGVAPTHLKTSVTAPKRLRQRIHLARCTLLVVCMIGRSADNLGRPP